jgi:replication fork clamp-binding protein CrfC
MQINLTSNQRAFLRLLIEERMIEIEMKLHLLDGKKDEPGSATIEFARTSLQLENDELSNIYRNL